MELRTQLDLYASVLHARSLYGIPSPLDNTPDGKPGPKIDVILIRENTEGEYSGLEHESVPGVRLLCSARCPNAIDYRDRGISRRKIRCAGNRTRWCS